MESCTGCDNVIANTCFEGEDANKITYRNLPVQPMRDMYRSDEARRWLVVGPRAVRYLVYTRLTCSATVREL